MVLVVLYLVYALPFLSHHMVERLEQWYPVYEAEAEVEVKAEAEVEAEVEEPLYIIVLGAGSTADPRLGYNQMLSQTVTVRLMEAIRVFQLHPEAILVTSASAVHGNLSQAEILRRTAIELGVPDHQIRVQETPTNTCEEAKAFVDAHGEGSRVIIATSAIHMRRAMMLFRQFGAEPVAAPTGYRIKDNPNEPFRLRHFLPSMYNIRLLESAIKEEVGYWRGCG